MDGGTLAMYALPTNFGGAQNRGGYRGRPPGIPVVPDQKDMKERFVNPLLGTQAVATFDGKRMRKAIHRKTVDYNSAVIKYVQNRIWQRDYRDKRAIQPDNLYQLDIEPPCSTLENPINAVTTKFVRTSTNKFRCPIFVLTWTPEGRRLVTGASSGEFTLWNGLAFNFETILQAHDTSVRAMRWSHNDQWMVTADHSGYIKYWQTNMNNVKMYQGHKEPVRGISFCPSDSKFATCSDDGTVRLWDFVRGHEERILRGHGADVKSVDWHPTKALIASGSKDNQQPIKLWDPRTGNSLATIHGHKHTVMQLSWNQNGNWLLTASRDHLLKLFDIRNMKEEIHTFKGHKKEATAVAWHPIHEGLFASGGSDGAIMFWMVGCDREVGSMEEAHEGMVWTLAWHPMGHILASGSNDHSTKFFTRNRPGDRMRDKYNLNNLPAGTEQELLEYDLEPQLMPSLPGMGLEHGLPEHLKPKEDEEEALPTIPGLDLQSEQQLLFQQSQDAPKKKIPYARPIPRSFEQAWKDNKNPLPVEEGADSEQRTPKRLKKKDSPEQEMFDDKNGRRRNDQRPNEGWQQQQHMDSEFHGPAKEGGVPGSKFPRPDNQFKEDLKHGRSQMPFGQQQGPNFPPMGLGVVPGMGPVMPGMQQMGPRGSQSEFLGGQGEMRGGPQGQRQFNFGGNQQPLQQGMMGNLKMADMRKANMMGQPGHMREPHVMQPGLSRAQQHQAIEFGQGSQDQIPPPQPMSRGFGRPPVSTTPFRGVGPGQQHNGEDQDFRKQAFGDRDEREMMGDLDLRQMGQPPFGGGSRVGAGPDRGRLNSNSQLGRADFVDRELSGRTGPAVRGGAHAGYSQQQQRGQRGEWFDDDDLRQGRNFPNDVPIGGGGQQRGLAGPTPYPDRGGNLDDDIMGDYEGYHSAGERMIRGRGQRLDLPTSNRGRQFSSPNRGRMGPDQGQYFDYSGDEGPTRKRGFDDGPGSWDRGGPPAAGGGGGQGVMGDDQGVQYGRSPSGWQGSEVDSLDDFPPHRPDHYASPRGAGPRGGPRGSGGPRGGRSRGMSGGRAGGRSGGSHMRGRGGAGGFRGGRGR